MAEDIFNRETFLKMCREVATKNLKEANGLTGHGLNASTCIFLLDEIDRLQAIIDRHDLCHDLHGKVGANEFAQGCAQEQRKLYGYAPHADQLAKGRKWFWIGIAIYVVTALGLILIAT